MQAECSAVLGPVPPFDSADLSLIPPKRVVGVGCCSSSHPSGLEGLETCSRKMHSAAEEMRSKVREVCPRGIANLSWVKDKLSRYKAKHGLLSSPVRSLSWQSLAFAKRTEGRYIVPYKGTASLYIGQCRYACNHQTAGDASLILRK